MKNIKTMLIGFSAILGLLTFSGLPVMAATAPCGDNCSTGGGPSGNPPADTGSTTGSTTPVNVNPDCNDPSASGLQTCIKNNRIFVDLNNIVDFLSMGVGIVVVGSIILGGIQYAMAGGSPDAVGKAKSRITNALIALVVFIFIFAFLQWIIPGGI